MVLKGDILGRRTVKMEKIAMERVKKLLKMADSIFEENPKLANRYVELAWKIKTRYNLRLSREFKIKFCRKCRSFLVPGETCRFRFRSSRMVITCLECGYEKRIPY